MVEYAYQYYMPLGMILWDTSLVQKDGVQFKVLKKYCYQLSVCWQVNTVISCQYVGR